MHQKKILVAVLFSFLFLLAFYTYVSVPLWDYDYWWHVATGRYIVSEGQLLDHEPFSFPSAMDENTNVHAKREHFILNQYWLAQIIFYLIFDRTGANGIVFLRGALLFCAILSAFMYFKRAKVNSYIAFIFLFLLFLMTMRSLGERPVLFSILFSAVVFVLLEEFRDRRGWSVFLLIPVMLVWANMHGGFLIGIVIIAVFMIGETLKIMLKKSTMSIPDRKAFYAAALLAIAASALNPSGLTTIEIVFSPKYNIFIQGIHEYRSPFFFYKEKILQFDYNYLFAVLASAVVVIVRNRKIELVRFMLLAGFLIMSLKVSRYCVFYGVIGSLVMGRELDLFIKEVIVRRFPEKTLSKIETGLVVLCLLSLAVFSVEYVNFKKLNFGGLNRSVTPVGAVDFIERNNVQGNMFNAYGFGGYITWRLYPRKNFIDTRALNKTVINEYDWIVQATKRVEGIDTMVGGVRTTGTVPLWETLLNHYKIDFAICEWRDIYGTVVPLGIELLDHDGWAPVYLDSISIVFLRNNDLNKPIIEAARIAKETVFNFLIVSISSTAIGDRMNPRSVASLGYIFYRQGRYADAVRAYELAFDRMKDPDIEKRIKEINEKIGEQNRLTSKDVKRRAEERGSKEKGL